MLKYLKIFTIKDSSFVLKMAQNFFYLTFRTTARGTTRSTIWHGAGIAWLSEWQARNWWTSRTINVGRSCRCTNELLCRWNLNDLRLRLADESLANFARFNDCSWLTNDFRVWNDFFVVDNLWLGHDSFLVNDARLADHFRLVNQFWLTNFASLRNHVTIDHSALCINDLFLTNQPWRLLNLHEVRSTLLRWANASALRHAA